MSNWNESAGPRYLFVATNLLQNKWGLGKSSVIMGVLAH